MYIFGLLALWFIRLINLHELFHAEDIVVEEQVLFYQ